MLLCSLAVTIGALATAGGAGAVIKHERNGRTLSFMPLRHKHPMLFDSAFSNLDYNGGPVMASNTNYPVYWAPPGSPAYPAGYQEGVNRYLQDLAHDSGGNQNVDSVATQYGDSAGHHAAYDSHFGEALIDTDPYPANGCNEAAICLSDAQIQAELSKFVKAHGLPTDLAHEYFLLTPPGVESCFEGGFYCSAGAEEFAAFCAYHGNAPQSDGSQLIYANDPYVGGNIGCDDGNHPNGISDSAIEGGLSHEHNESTTDPVPNSAWADFGGLGGENGDKCRNVELEEEFGVPVGEDEIGGEKVKYNQVVNGHHYWYQQEWSNQGSTCLQRFTLSGSLPTAAFTAKAEPGQVLKVNATGSTTGSGYRYNWQFNDEEPFNTPSEPFESTLKTAEHEYFRPCRYLVALTVFAPDGTSTGTAKTVTVGPLVKPEPEIFFEPETPEAGSPVEFFAEPEEDEGGIITNFEWNFGDGSPAVSSFFPEHTYASPGTYDVAVTATDICGESGTAHQVVSVTRSAEEIAEEKAQKEKEAKEAAEKAKHEKEVKEAEERAAKEAAERAAREQAEREAKGVTSPAPGPAIPAAIPTGTLKAAASISARADGKARARITCTGTAKTCSGEGVLTVKSHGRTRTIATFRISVAANHTTTVSLRLSSLGRSLLRAAHGHLRASLSLRRTLPAPAARGNTAVTVTLARH